MTLVSNWLNRHSRLTIILAMFFWGASFPAMKFSVNQMDPFFVVFVRMLFGSACLLPFFRVLPKFNYQKHDIWWLLALVFCEPCLYFYFEINALQLTSATQAGFIAATLPLMVMTGSALILREKIHLKSIIGMLLAFLGVSMLTLTSETNASAPNPILGNVYEVFAMLSATGFTLILKLLSDRYHPVLLTLFQTLAGMTLYAFSAFNSQSFAQLFSDPITFGILLFLGIMVTVVTYVFYINGIQRIPAHEAILFVNLIPVFGMILSMLFLGERIFALQGLACVLVIAGVLVGQKHKPVIDHNSA